MKTTILEIIIKEADLKTLCRTVYCYVLIIFDVQHMQEQKCTLLFLSDVDLAVFLLYV